MIDACGVPHTQVGLCFCPVRLQVGSTRSNRYFINAMRTRRRVPFAFLQGDDLPGFPGGAFSRPAEWQCIGPAWCRLPRHRAGAGRRPAGRHAGTSRSDGYSEFVTVDQHCPYQTGILGGDCHDRLTVANTRLQANSPAAHAIASCRSQRKQ